MRTAAATMAAEGVPDDLEALAKDHPVRGVVNVRSWEEECHSAIRNGYPVLVCSSQGFTIKRDAGGVLQPAREVVPRDGGGRTFAAASGRAGSC